MKDLEKAVAACETLYKETQQILPGYTIDNANDRFLWRDKEWPMPPEMSAVERAIAFKEVAKEWSKI